MPFIYDMTNPELLEDEDEFAPPSVKDFVYLPAPEYHSVRPPVIFSISPPDFDRPEPMPPFPRSAPPGRRIADLFRGRQQPSDGLDEQRKAWSQESRRRSELQLKWRAQTLFSILVPGLKTAGVGRAYCRYDGGNDEGFAWFDHYESADGAPIESDLIGAKLFEMRVHDRLLNAGFLDQIEVTGRDHVGWLGNYAGSMLSHQWASILLGDSFGTGEYMMYGAFAVDLESCTLTDDPNADPVVSNIEIAREGE